MTAPVFVVDASALSPAVVGGRVAVSGPEGRHAVTVRRLTVGEAVDLVDGGGVRVSGTVAQIVGKDSFEVSVGGIEREAEPQPRLTVVQALPKGDRGEFAVELLTEVGVDEIVPWAAANCVTRWKPDRSERSWQRWSDAARAAAKQSRRARFPLVAPLASTREVADRLASATTAIVLHEDGSVPIADIAMPASGEVILVVGPEGGLHPDELAAFPSALIVRLGPSVLRTSSAGMAAASALLSRTSRWQLPSEADGALGPGVEG